jgi:hypothetical protein
MREYEFRGMAIPKKYRDHKGWVFGYLIQCYDLCIKPGNNASIAIVPETVGQYAEIKDHNKTKIYDGDIVREKEGRTTFIGVVNFSGGCWCLKIEGNNYPLHGELGKGYKFEVIGNIHENPELLGGNAQ